MSATYWQTWCPCKDSDCPKQTRQVGSWSSFDAAVAGLEHHLRSSTYHHLSEADAKEMAAAAHYESHDMPSGDESEIGASSKLPPVPARPTQLIPKQLSATTIENVVKQTIASLTDRRPQPPPAPRRRSRSPHDQIERASASSSCSKQELIMIRDSLTRAATALRVASRMAASASIAFAAEGDAVVAAREDIDAVLVRRGI